MRKKIDLVENVERMVLTVQEAGTERGVRIYFGTKEIKKIKEKYGENFFLFNNKKMMATIDSTNETITLGPFVPSTNIFNTTALMDEELHFFQSIEEDQAAPQIEVPPSDLKLDFYIPMGGVGEEYYIAEVCVNGKLAFYCVTISPDKLEKDLIRVGDKHFPGLLESNIVQVKKFAEYLVYSPVPSGVAKNAYENVAPKRIHDVEVPARYSVPYDAELTPIVDIGESSADEMEVKKRKLLAKYEIMALASRKAKVNDINLIEMNNALVWEVITENGESYYDLTNGNDVTKSILKQTVGKIVRERPIGKFSKS